MSEAETVYRLLMELAAIGRPALRQMDHGGWYASVDLSKSESVTAIIQSDFKHATPLEALQCVHDRLEGLHSAISVTAPVAGTAHFWRW